MTVVLAADGGDHTAKAVDESIRLARGLGQPLYVVHVIITGIEDVDASLARAHELFDSIKAKAEALGVEVHPVVEYGTPAESILAAVERLNADLIVTGSSGKSAFGRVILGSVSEALVRKAPCTVVVAR